MRRFAALLATVVLVSVGFVLVGCDQPANHTEKSPVKKDDHDHEHAHHGPHDGHIAEFGDHEYHLEWTHDDASGKVSLYVLDGEAKKEVRIGAEELVIVTKQEDESKEYVLAAVNIVDGETAQFEIVDKELLGALEAQIPAEVKQIEVGGKTFSNVKLEEDKEHHH